MFTRIRQIFIVTLCLFSLSIAPLANAQDEGGGGEDDILGQSMGDLIIVAGAGIGELF